METNYYNDSKTIIEKLEQMEAQLDRKVFLLKEYIKLKLLKIPHIYVDSIYFDTKQAQVGVYIRLASNCWYEVALLKDSTIKVKCGSRNNDYINDVESINQIKKVLEGLV